MLTVTTQGACNRNMSEGLFLWEYLIIGLPACLDPFVFQIKTILKP